MPKARSVRDFDCIKVERNFHVNIDILENDDEDFHDAGDVGGEKFEVEIKIDSQSIGGLLPFL